eukprot:SAG31_NODE_42_length_31262_cov_46.416231_23_plen_98_part_00
MHLIQVMAGLGFHTTLDLQFLVAGGHEAEELMRHLAAAQGVTLGDRAKIRMLIGGEEQLHSVSKLRPMCSVDGDIEPSIRRKTQDEGSGISTDTVAA